MRTDYSDGDPDREANLYVLKQLIQLSSNSNQGADLQYLGGASKTGVSLISKIINGYKEFKLISLSPTGLYKAEIDLLNL